MPIRILTLGRPHKQVTFEGLPGKYQDRIQFVVQHHDFYNNEASYLRLAPRSQFYILPEEISNLHQTREYLLQNTATSYDMQMDDDLVFSARRQDEPTKFRPMEDDDFDHMFAAVLDALDEGFALVGVSHREGANRNTEARLESTRQMRIHAFQPKRLRELGVRWDLLRSPGPEDFCMILQLLTRGWMNVVLNDWVHNQGGSNVDGGCSLYRTPDVHADACHHLSELYPDFVKVVQKDTKGSWGGGTRTDVRIQWKKAYDYGRRQA